MVIILFLFVSSKGAIQKYVSVLQRYFVQYLGGFDVTVLKEVVQVCLLHVHVTHCLISNIKFHPRGNRADFMVRAD